MAQRSIPLQPNETDVTAALRKLADIMGWAVTHTTDGEHAKSSYHYRGQAVDLAALSGPSSNSPQLLEINREVLQAVPLPFIKELIYGGPGRVCVKNGVVLTQPVATYGLTLLRNHENHVHLAVSDKFKYNGSQNVADDPNLPNITGPVSFHPIFDSTGDVKGYYIFSTKTGELHSFGDGAKIHYYNRSEVLQ